MFKYLTNKFSATNRLIYLHIEKSAGTSLRRFFKAQFGEENIFWYQIANKSTKFNHKEVRNKPIIGGHRSFDFYKNSNAIYLAVVRQPIESVYSLYNFFISQPFHMENWGNKPGFDPESFDQTLIHCKAFRDRIENTQCRYFSCNKTFEESLITIKKNKFLIGCLDQLNQFTNALSQRLNLTNTDFPKINVGQKDYKKKFSISDESQKILNEILYEDCLLYNYIANQPNRVFNNVLENDWKSFNAKLNKRPN